MWLQSLPWSGQAPVVINRDLIDTAINLMKCGWVFVPPCCDKRCCTLNCKYCQNVLALPLKKISKGGTFSVVLFFVCTGGDVRFFSFKGFQWLSVILCFSSGWGHWLFSWRSLCWRVNTVGEAGSSAETVVASWHPSHLILLLSMGLAPCFWHVLLDG